MSRLPSPQLVTGDLEYPECPRWHDDALWLSEMWAHTVVRIDQGGHREVVHRFGEGERPGGLGWLPDGRLGVVGMASRCLYVIDGDERLRYADLTAFSAWSLNDMVIGPGGDAYVTQVGFDLDGGTSRPAPSSMLRVAPGGVVSVAASELMVPNGVALSGDGGTLVVAETFAGRLSAFSVGGDGRLGERRVLAEVPPAPGHRFARPDGICLDEQGSVWVADWLGRRALCISAEGVVTGQIDLADHALAVALGGPDRRTLFICTSALMVPPVPGHPPAGALFSVPVDVPGAR